MSDLITLTIPHRLTERARQLAAQRAQSVEQVLLEQLQTSLDWLPELATEQADELRALHALSDDALWTIAREQMPAAIQAQAHELMTQNTRGTITDADYQRLNELVARADRLLLRKAEAATILRQRGYTFSTTDFAAPKG